MWRLAPTGIASGSSARAVSGCGAASPDRPRPSEPVFSKHQVTATKCYIAVEHSTSAQRRAQEDLPMPVLTEKTQDANLHMWACPDAKAAVAVDAASHRLAFMTLPGFRL